MCEQRVEARVVGGILKIGKLGMFWPAKPQQDII